MREFFDLANNPLFVKHVRTRLRRSTVWPGVIIVAFLSLCIVFFDIYFEGVRNRAAAQKEANPNIGLHLFFWLQGIIVVVMGGSQVATSITQMKESGIIDFHRITPIPPGVQTIGIMLGAPIRELIMYAVTLPFAFFLALIGPIGPANFAKLLVVQLGSALMYYSLAMITGLATVKARGASGRFVAILAIVNLLSIFCFSARIYGPTLITSMPVYNEVFFENEAAQAEKQRAAQMRAQQQQQFNPRNPGAANAVPPPLPVEPNREVTFYGVPFPVVLQSLLFQGSILTFLFMGASRRIHSARLPLYRKPVSLAFLLTLAFLTVGSLWSDPTILLTLGSVYFLTFCSIALTNTITPPQGEVIKGMQRARKLSGMQVPIWSDLSSNKYTVSGFALIMAAFVSIALLLAPQPPMLGVFQLQTIFIPWLSLLVGVLTVLSYGFVSQYFALAFGHRAKAAFTLYIFFFFIVPIIVGILGRSARVEGYYSLMISPIVGIATAGIDDLPNVNEVAVKVASITPVALCTLVFFVLLLNQEKRLISLIMEEHAAGERKHRGREMESGFEDEEYRA